MAKIPNPAKYVDGSALGHFLKQNKWPKNPPQGAIGPPIVIPGGRARGAGGYNKGGRGG